MSPKREKEVEMMTMMRQEFLHQQGFEMACAWCEERYDGRVGLTLNVILTQTSS